MHVWKLLNTENDKITNVHVSDRLCARERESFDQQGTFVQCTSSDGGEHTRACTALTSPTTIAVLPIWQQSCSETDSMEARVFEEILRNPTLISVNQIPVLLVQMFEPTSGGARFDHLFRHAWRRYLVQVETVLGVSNCNLYRPCLLQDHATESRAAGQVCTPNASFTAIQRASVSHGPVTTFSLRCRKRSWSQSGIQRRGWQQCAGEFATQHSSNTSTRWPSLRGTSTSLSCVPSLVQRPLLQALQKCLHLPPSLEESRNNRARTGSQHSETRREQPVEAASHSPARSQSLPPWARRLCVRLCPLHSTPQNAEGEPHYIYIYIYIYIYYISCPHVSTKFERHGHLSEPGANELHKQQLGAKERWHATSKCRVLHIADVPLHQNLHRGRSPWTLHSFHPTDSMTAWATSSSCTWPRPYWTQALGMLGRWDCTKIMSSRDGTCAIVSKRSQPLFAARRRAAWQEHRQRQAMQGGPRALALLPSSKTRNGPLCGPLLGSECALWQFWVPLTTWALWVVFFMVFAAFKGARQKVP